MVLGGARFTEGVFFLFKSVYRWDHKVMWWISQEEKRRSRVSDIQHISHEWVLKFDPYCIHPLLLLRSPTPRRENYPSYPELNSTVGPGSYSLSRCYCSRSLP